jgi:uroporphyrin-III C-methyltransferase / precorrin-2 dehydrogenase / sirohydrochlorin ferrochelatase
MSFLPIFLQLQDRRCLVVGGGAVAARKVGHLLRAGARVTVVAHALCRELTERRNLGEIEHEARTFARQDLDGAWLCIAATDDVRENGAVSALAQERHIPVNVVDDPERCTFIMPSIVDRTPVQIAISTGGASPVLARLLRARLETLVPAAYGRLAALMAAFRERVKQRFRDVGTRRRFWETVLHGPVAEMLFAGRDQAALAALEQALCETSEAPLSLGEVYLVGAGPGDPDLLTFRALRLMQQADIVLYDRLVAPAILDLVRKDAERVHVGKSRDEHRLAQKTINDLLVDLALEGKRVLRLKGGDPFIFGRGGEEIDTLSAHGIPFQVVPGITAASGCAAYAGIPLTHRDFAHSCVFVTGHLQDGSTDLNWNALVQPHQTVAVYMGLSGLPVLCRELIAHGMAAATPAALIEQGTTVHQRVITGTLEGLPGVVAEQEVHAPTLVIVGEVVRLREKLAWFAPGDPR